MGTIHYKSPELLFHYKKYDYSIDVWAGGCVLAELLLVKHPIFAGNTTNTMI